MQFITTNREKSNNVNKCGRWKVQNRAVVTLYRKKYEKNRFSKKLKVEEIKCRDESENKLPQEERISKDARF